MRRRPHLVIFARAPRLGAVKRRLAAEAGALAAWRFHRLTTAALLRRFARDPRWTTWLAVTPDRATHAPRALWPEARHPRVRITGQGAGDLGARMGRVMHGLPPGPAVIVGSDVPGIRPRHVADAFRLLGTHDAVLGPAEDGGYWLVGLKRTPVVRPPFAGVRWGGPHALADTLANLPAQGARVALLEELADVDTAADLRKLEARRVSRPLSGAPAGGA